MSKLFRSPVFIAIADGASGPTLGETPEEDAFAAAYAGVIQGEDGYFIGKAPKVRLAQGMTPDWRFLGRDGLWTSNPNVSVPIVNARIMDSTQSNWKITSTYAVDGSIYVFSARL